MRIANFGGNVSFEPKHYYEPRTEQDVLDILDRHKDGKIRVLASGHAWSTGIICDDVVISINALNAIDIDRSGPTPTVTAGGGTILRVLLGTIHEQTDCTLPTYGGITKQTIAGVVSTATHGSGRSSVSHYMDVIRVAAYDPASGKARVFEYAGGDELRAARTAIGAMGVILSVRFRTVPKYLVEQTMVKVSSVAEALSTASPDQLEWFTPMPYSGDVFVARRKVLPAGTTAPTREKVVARRRREFWFTDVGLHLMIKIAGFLIWTGLAGRGFVTWLHGKFIGSQFPTGHAEVDNSHEMITIRHDLFRHIEMELFTPASKTEAMIAFMLALVDYLADGPELPDAMRADLERVGLFEKARSLRGRYFHNFPLVMRRVLPDDSLIGTTAGASEAYYAMGLFCYHPFAKYDEFLLFCDVAAPACARLFGSRPHWGKHNPLGAADVAAVFPSLQKFREIASSTDPKGVFRNAYISEKLGF